MCVYVPNNATLPRTIPHPHGHIMQAGKKHASKQATSNQHQQQLTRCQGNQSVVSLIQQAGGIGWLWLHYAPARHDDRTLLEAQRESMQGIA